MRFGIEMCQICNDIQGDFYVYLRRLSIICGRIGGRNLYNSRAYPAPLHALPSLLNQQARGSLSEPSVVPVHLYHKPVQVA